MRQVHLTFPELGLVAMTRAAGGIGIGLLLAGRLSSGQRKALGWGLLALGAATTVPLAADILGRSCAASRAEREQEWTPTRA